MTKAEIISTVATKSGLTKKQVEDVFDKTFDIIRNELVEGKDVSISGFGKFSVKDRVARQGRDLRTGAPIAIPARKAVHFGAFDNLKSAINR